MSEKKTGSLRDIAVLTDEPLYSLEPGDLIELPFIDSEPPVTPAPPHLCSRYDLSFDGFTPLGIPHPVSDDDKRRLVEGFLSGLGKLLDPQDNWPFLQIFRLSLDYCTNCQTCAEQCHVYLASGRQEIYKPTHRTEVLRRLYRRYFTAGGRILRRFAGADIELNHKTVIRLLESSYRCGLCRRCAQACPVGVDNALIAREIRKLFSQEMGIAPEELFRKGTRKHLLQGSAAGMTEAGLKNIIEFMEEDIHERTGRKVNIPLDRKGADILLYHNAGEFISWPDSVEAFAVLFDAAGINYTLSSEAVGMDAVNYGLFFDDIELARIGLRHLRIAGELGVKKIVAGECGHAHKVFCVTGDRVFPGDLSLSEIPRESCFPLFREIVNSGAVKFDPMKNNFPVTLQDPCSITRMMGIVRPQRNVINRICPQFREMEPHGVRNYCCGGGSGFGLMRSYNFDQWKIKTSQRLKTRQILEVFGDIIGPDVKKCIIAPCSNCKGSMREIIGHYGLGEKFNISYTGMAELMVNAIAGLPAFIKWDDE